MFPESDIDRASAAISSEPPVTAAKEKESPSKPKAAVEASAVSVVTQEQKGIFRRFFGLFKNNEDSKQELLGMNKAESSVNHNSISSQGFSPFTSNNLGNEMPSQHVQAPPDEDGEEASEIELSLCGHIITDSDQITGGEQVLQAFEDYKVSFEHFCKNPHALLCDARLVIRIEEQYYNWQTAAPIIISLLAFKQPISNDIVGQPLVEVQQAKQVPEIEVAAAEEEGSAKK